MHRLLFLFSLTCLLAFSAEFSDVLLANVGDTVITLNEVLAITGQQEKALHSQLFGKELDRAIAQLRDSTLDMLIARELLYLEFQALKGTVPPEIIQQRINENILTQTNGNRAKFEASLEEQGTSIDEYRQKITKDLAVEFLLHDRTTRGNIFSNREVEDYFHKNSSSFIAPEEYHIAVIQLKKEGRYAGKINDTFQEIIRKLKDGTPFQDLAKQYSEGTAAQKGGDQGWLSSPHEKLLEILKSIKDGQTSMTMAEIGSSFYIVQLIERKGGTLPEMTPELRDKIRAQMLHEESNKRYNELLRELYMKYPVKRIDGTASNTTSQRP